jgi:hypothetical protein
MGIGYTRDEGQMLYGPRKSLPKSPRRSRNHPTQKDVKNEGCSQWLIENKGAKKVVLRVY